MPSIKNFIIPLTLPQTLDLQYGFLHQGFYDKSSKFMLTMKV